MDISFLSIKNILTNNRLIRGRIRLTSRDIHRLYRTKLKQNQKIKIEISKENNIAKSSLEKIKILKYELKYCEETLQKAFHPSTENIALLYKNVGNHCYIKARFYWQGQQREVQVGSIPIVLSIIQKMLVQGYLHDISVPKTGQITWDQFKNKAHLIEATKEIAALKFQEYIIRKISIDETEQFEKGELEKIYNTKRKKKGQTKKYEGEISDEEKFDWYVQWRTNNIK